MFRLLSAIIFFILIGWFTRAFLTQRPKRDLLKQTFIDWLNRIQLALRNIKKPNASNIINHIVFPIMILCIFILAVTGFFSVIVLGKPISGYLLILHVAVAPLFAVCMTVISLVWSHQHAFGEDDKKTLKFFITRKRGKKNANAILKNLFFWMMIILSLPVILSIALSMFPIFGSIGQHSLLQWHRYCALAYGMVFLGYLYLYLFMPTKPVKK